MKKGTPDSETSSPIPVVKKLRRPLPPAVKYIINILIVLIITVVVVIYSTYNNFVDIMSTLSNAFATGVGIGWTFGAFGLMLLAFLIDALVIFSFSRLYTRRYTFGQATAAQSYKFFYDGIDPIQSAGKVMQANVLSKQKIPLASAASIMVMCFIVNGAALLVFETISFAIKAPQILSLNVPLFTDNAPLPMIVPTILGFAVDLLLIFIPLLLAYSKTFKKIILRGIIPLLTKMKILKNPDKTTEKVNVLIETFKIELKRLLSNIPFTFLIFFLFGLGLLVRGSIPYFTAQAVGDLKDGAQYIDFVLLTTFHQMIASAIPIPGSSGVSEAFFAVLFYEYFDNASAAVPAVVLLWRTITYTLPLVVTGFASAFYKPGGKARVQEEGLYHTVASLQMATYEERKRSSDIIYETAQLNRQMIQERIFRKKINTDPLKGIDIKNESEIMVYFNSGRDVRRKPTENKLNTKPRRVKSSHWTNIEVVSKEDAFDENQ